MATYSENTGAYTCLMSRGYFDDTGKPSDTVKSNDVGTVGYIPAETNSPQCPVPLRNEVAVNYNTSHGSIEASVNPVNGLYDYKQPLSITATPNSGYIVSHFLMNDDSGSNIFYREDMAILNFSKIFEIKSSTIITVVFYPSKKLTVITEPYSFIETGFLSGGTGSSGTFIVKVRNTDRPLIYLGNPLGGVVDYYFPAGSYFDIMCNPTNHVADDSSAGIDGIGMFKKRDADPIVYHEFAAPSQTNHNYYYYPIVLHFDTIIKGTATIYSI